MKRIHQMLLLAVLLLCSLLPVMAQAEHDPFHPMLQDGKMWHINLNSPDREYVYLIDGDTLIHDMTWKKVYSNRHEYPYPDTDTTYFAAMREDGDKVYGIYHGHDTERLLYDFGIGVGKMYCAGSDSNDETDFCFCFVSDYFDNTMYYIHITPVLQQIDTIEVCGHSLRRYIFTSDWGLRSPARKAPKRSRGYPYMVWVEGIGSDGGLTLAWSKISVDCRVSCSMNGTTIFSSDDFQSAAKHTDSETPILNQPKYYPLGTSWRVGKIERPGGEHIPDLWHYAIEGDTIIGDYQYYRVVKYSTNDQDFDYMRYMIREVDDKVYVYSTDTGTEIMYYDYDWTSTDRHVVAYLYEYFYIPLIADRKQMITLADGNEYEYMPDDYKLIRTIGKTESSNIFGDEVDPKVSAYDIYVSSFIRNGVELMPGYDGINTIENGFMVSSSNQLTMDNSIFDIAGQRIDNSKLRKGIFIKNGKKVVVK